MRVRTALSKKDVLVALCCIVFLLVNLSAIGSSGRERAKRTICLSNLHRLGLAWSSYADDNQGNIVNGGEWSFARMSEYELEEVKRSGEYPWCGIDWRCGSDVECWEKEIKEGNLYPYLQDIKLYKCPNSKAGELRTYSVISAMNGSWAMIDGPEIIKNKMQIDRPAKRMVFIDEGRVSPDSFIIRYSQECFYDQPPDRHSGGATFSFADGHAEYWKWNKRTIEAAHLDYYSAGGDGCTYGEANQDLYRLQIAAWGELGYEPSIPPKW